MAERQHGTKADQMAVRTDKAERKILVIVESPTKANTISKSLGKEYIVEASMGHVIDLPKSRMAVNVENGFEPDYITVRGRGKVLNTLKRLAGKSKEVLLRLTKTARERPSRSI